jgi:hypothetical protein
VKENRFLIFIKVPKGSQEGRYTARNAGLNGPRRILKK